MIDRKTARAIGVAPEAAPQIIAEYLCRQADIKSIDTLPAQAAERFVNLAMAMGHHLPEWVDVVRAETLPEWRADEVLEVQTSSPYHLDIEAVAKSVAA